MKGFFFVQYGETSRQMVRLDAQNMRDAVIETEEIADDLDYVIEVDGEPEIIERFGHCWIDENDCAVFDIARWRHADGSAEGLERGWYVEYCGYHPGEYIPYDEWVK